MAASVNRLAQTFGNLRDTLTNFVGVDDKIEQFCTRVKPKTVKHDANAARAL